jgi:hypothetical protein
MVTTEKDLTLAAKRIYESESCLESIDRILRPGIIQPKNDRELAKAIGINEEQVAKIITYLEDGIVDLGLGNCPHCSGWGRFGDDIFCDPCKGTGDVS